MVVRLATTTDESQTAGHDLLSTQYGSGTVWGQESVSPVIKVMRSSWTFGWPIALKMKVLLRRDQARKG